MLEVREGQLGKGLYTSRALKRGEVVVTAWGTIGKERTRHSLQVDRDAHVTVDNELRLINHSCEPNCGLLICPEVPVLEVHALRPVAAGEELTLDYATFEDDIRFMPGRCLCGSSICRGQVTGYDGLPAERRAALHDFIAGYLRAQDVPVSRAG